MSKWMKKLAFGAAFLGLLGMTACKRVVVRDPETYKNEVYLLEMTIEQDTELLKEHLADGSCSCDEDGNWNNEVCEASALNVVVMEARLKWHVAMMLFLGGLSDKDPGEIPEVSEDDVVNLCPDNG